MIDCLILRRKIEGNKTIEIQKILSITLTMDQDCRAFFRRGYPLPLWWFKFHLNAVKVVPFQEKLHIAIWTRNTLHWNNNPKTSGYSGDYYECSVANRNITKMLHCRLIQNVRLLYE